MVNFKSILVNLLALSAIGFTSCSHNYYAPNEGVLLALNEKNDVKVSVGGGENSSYNNDEESTFSLQGGYSPINHLGVQSSYFTYKGKGTQNGVAESGNGFIANAAIGTYYRFPLKKNRSGRERLPDNLAMQRSILIDFYGGYAKGKVHNYYNPSTNSHFEFNKRFIQLGFHWQGRILGIDFTSKFGNLDYSTGIVNGKIAEQHLRDIQNVEKNDSYSFRENSLRIHIGIRHMRLFMTGTWFNSPKENQVEFITDNAHFGVIVDIDEFFRKRGAKPGDVINTLID